MMKLHFRQECLSDAIEVCSIVTVLNLAFDALIIKYYETYFRQEGFGQLGH